jgi:lipopolysaccharide/colanic/teichoic acid biosynthesis glycosyltransferase
MALVGPGPVTEEHVMRWGQSIPRFERRFLVRPGITGLAQISGFASDDPETIARRCQYDLYYVEHRSLVLDLRTLFRTAGILFRGRSIPAQRDALGLPPTGPRGAVYSPATSAVKGVMR